jgi:hypothetical protein
MTKLSFATNDKIRVSLNNYDSFNFNEKSLFYFEPHSVCGDDGKRPDAMTVLPWANGRCMVWDFTCRDTLTASHLNHAVVGLGALAGHADSWKIVKYNALSPLYRLVTVAAETIGALGDEAIAHLRIAAVTGESRSHQFLMQRLSVTVQRRNAAYVLGTAASNLGLDDICYL